MPIGPGKYDDLCTYVSEQVGTRERGGGVLLIVLNGDRGNGFSCTADYETILQLPDILEAAARQLRQEMSSKGTS